MTLRSMLRDHIGSMLDIILKVSFPDKRANAIGM